MYQYSCIRFVLDQLDSFLDYSYFEDYFPSRKEGSHLAMISEQLARSSLDKLAEKNPQSALSDMKS